MTKIKIINLKYFSILLFCHYYPISKTFGLEFRTKKLIKEFTFEIRKFKNNYI